MPIKTRGYAALSAKAPLGPFTFERRDPGPNDVVIKILYCGICHSDIHQARDEWGGSAFPMVPGHEIVGHVSAVGASVQRYKVGDAVGVGCFVDSCRDCAACRQGEEQYCDGQLAFTYNGIEKDGKTRTQGGYSDMIVVNEDYVLRIPPALPLDRAAPLLCAGITTYSPLKHWGVGPGQKVGVVGLGGLGHMAVKIAAALGAEVTVFSTSPSKEADARRLGAKNFAVSKDPKVFEGLAGRFDFIIDTVSAAHDLNQYLGLLRLDGTMVVVGVPEKPAEVAAFHLIGRRRTLAGSLIGGIRETQEMLDFCAEKGIASDVEVIPVQKINEAYERTVRADVKYRFVIDLATLGAAGA